MLVKGAPGFNNFVKAISKNFEIYTIQMVFT